jgi:hypothetical protein
MLNTISGLLAGGAPPTDYESIQTITVGSGGQASVTFSSIPSTYTHLQIRAIGRSTNSGSRIRIRFNSDTSTQSSYHYLFGSGTAAGAGGGANQATSGAVDIGLIPVATATANLFGATIADILDYTNTNKYKTVRSLQGLDTNNTGTENLIMLTSSAWLSTSAITSIELIPNTFSFAEYSSFALYGIK